MLTLLKINVHFRFNSQGHHRRYHQQKNYQHHDTQHLHQQHHSGPPSHHQPHPVFRNEHTPISRTDDKIVLSDRNGAPRGYAQVIKKRAHAQTSRTNGYYYRRVVMITSHLW